MKYRIYWTYSQRHPLPRGSVKPSELISRVFDRLDDSITALAANMEFRRIERRHRRMNLSAGNVTCLHSEKRNAPLYRRIA